MKLLIAMNLFIAALRKIISKTPIEDGGFSNLKIIILLVYSQAASTWFWRTDLSFFTCPLNVSVA